MVPVFFYNEFSYVFVDRFSFYGKLVNVLDRLKSKRLTFSLPMYLPYEGNVLSG